MNQRVIFSAESCTTETHRWCFLHFHLHPVFMFIYQTNLQSVIITMRTHYILWCTSVSAASPVLGPGHNDPSEAKLLPQSVWQASRMARLRCLTSFVSSVSPSLIAQFIQDLPAFNLSQSLAHCPFTFTSGGNHVLFGGFFSSLRDDCRCTYFVVCMNERWLYNLVNVTL